MAILKFVVGTDEYNNDKLLSAMFNNIDEYAKREHMSDAEKDLFKLAVGYTLQGMKNGTISQIDVNGNIVDSVGQGNGMMGQVNHYMRELLKNDETSSLAYREAAKKKYNRNLDDDFKEYFNAGKDPDDEFLTNWNNLDADDGLGNRATAARAAAYSKMLLDKIRKILAGEYDMSEVDLLAELNNLQEAVNALADGVITDAEKAILAKAGHSSGATNLLFGNGNITKSNTWEKDRRQELAEAGYTKDEIDQRIAMEKQSRRWDIEDEYLDKVDEHNSKQNDRLAKKHRDDFLKFARQQYNKDFIKKWTLGTPTYANAADYEKAIAEIGVDPSKYLPYWLLNPEGTTGQYANTRWLANFLNYAANNEQYASLFFTPDENGTYIINSSLNYGTGRALVYNPQTGTLIETSPLRSAVIRKLLEDLYMKNHPAPTVGNSSSGTSSVWVKNGGVLKYQTGGDITSGFSTAIPTGILDLAVKNTATRKLNDIKLRAEENNTTLENEQYLESTGGPAEFNESDRLRFVNLLNDLSSIGTSYIPVYGTALAGALGLASMGLDLIADIKDKNVSKGEVLSNLAQNAGIAALGMIPGGASKMGKVWKTFKKLLPAGLSAYGLMGEINDPKVRKSLDKLISSGKENELNNEDWKNLMGLAKMVAFGHNTAKAASQSFNSTLKNSKWSPALLRQFGELSAGDFVGGTRGSAINRKLIQLGSLNDAKASAAKVTGVKGRSITVTDGKGHTKDITITTDAFKKMEKLAKGAKDKTKALDKINNYIHTELSKENPTILKGNKTDVLKDFEFKTESRVDAISELIPEDNQLAKGSIMGYLQGMIDGSGSKPIELKLKGNKKITLSKPEAESLLKAFKDKVGKDELKFENNKWNEDILTDEDFSKGLEGLNSKLVELIPESDVRRTGTLTTTENPIKTTLTTDDISDTHWWNKLGIGGRSISAEKVDTNPGMWQNTKDYISNLAEETPNKYAGNSKMAIANRAKLIRANALEKAYNGQPSTLFSNNWEVANGMGPFRFGLGSDAMAKEKQYVQDLYERDNRYSKKVKDFRDSIAELSEGGFYDTEVGQRWRALEKENHGPLSEELALEFIKNENRLTDLGKDIFENESFKLRDGFLETVLADETLAPLFKNITDKSAFESQISDLVKIYHDKGITTGSNFIEALKKDLGKVDLADKSFEGLRKYHNDLEEIDSFIKTIPDGEAKIETEVRCNRIYEKSTPAERLLAEKDWVVRLKAKAKIKDEIADMFTDKEAVKNMSEEEFLKALEAIKNMSEEEFLKALDDLKIPNSNLELIKLHIFDKINKSEENHRIVVRNLNAWKPYKFGGKLQAINYLKSLKKGGNILKFAGGNNMMFSDANGRSNWRSEIFDKYSEDILNKINSKSGVDLDNYISSINNMLDNHAKLYLKYGSDYTKPVSFDKDVLEYLNMYDNQDTYGYNIKSGYDVIKLAYDRGRYTPHGNTRRNSGDSSDSSFKNDGLYGAITDDRRILGRISTSGEDDWDEASRKTFNERLKSKGLQLILDKKNNYYKIGKLVGNPSNPLNPNNPSNPTLYKEDGTLHPGKKTWGQIKNVGVNVVLNLWDNRDKLLEFKNYLDKEASNRKIYELAKLSNVTSLGSFLNAHIAEKKDNHTELLALKIASTINSKMGVNLKDSSNAAAMILEGTKQGLDAILQASQASDTTANNAAQQQAATLIDIANKNLAMRDSNDEREKATIVKASNDAKEFTAAKGLNKDTFFKTLIYDAKTDGANKKTFNDLLIKDVLANNVANDPEYKKMLKRYTELQYKTDLSDSEKLEQLDLYTKLQDTLQKLSSKSIRDYLTYLRHRNNPSLSLAFIDSIDILNDNKPNYKYKTGGEVRIKARTQDDKEFNKNIQNSHKNYLKQVDNLSKLTLLAVKKALNL